MKDYRNNYGEKMKEQIKRWFQHHVDYRQQWLKEHPGYHQKWRLNNENKYKLCQREWRKENRERKNLYMKEYMKSRRKTKGVRNKKNIPLTSSVIYSYTINIRTIEL